MRHLPVPKVARRPCLRSPNSPESLLIQTAQEQIVIGIRRQVEPPAQRLAQMPADFLPPRPRKHLAALHVEGKGQPERPVHLKTRRDRLRHLRDPLVAELQHAGQTRRLVHDNHRARSHVAQPLEAVVQRRGNEPHRRKAAKRTRKTRRRRNQRHGIDDAKHVSQHGLPGADRLAMDRDHPDVHGAFAQRLAVPHRLQQTAVEPMDEEQDDQEEAHRSCPTRPRRAEHRIPAPRSQRQDQDLDHQVDQVGRQTPRRPRQPIAEGDVFRGNDLHRRIDLFSTTVHSAHYGQSGR